MRRFPGQALVPALAVALVAFMPGAPAHAGGPETALENICVHVDGGRWTAAGLNCYKGTDRTVSEAASAVCAHAVGGEFHRYARIQQEPYEMTYGWECRVV
jgi:hypothetical protein